jgi:putative membrane protein
MPGMAPLGVSPWSWLPVVPLLVVAAGYLIGVRRLVRRGDRWPPARSGSAAAGLVALAAALLPPVSTHADVFTVHVVGHLLLAMLAPLLLALSAPITLVLRIVSVPVRRQVLAVVHSRAGRVLTWAPLVLALEVGGMYLLPDPAVLPRPRARVAVRRRARAHVPGGLAVQHGRRRA